MKFAALRYAVIFLLGICSALRAEEGDELPITNPFFLPNSGEFFLDWGFNFRSQGYRYDLSPISGSQETIKKEPFSDLTARLGIFDFLSIGITMKYMLAQQYSETRTGVLSATPDVKSTNNGFFDAGFLLAARFLGTGKDEWYLNTEFVFAPGIRDNNNFLFSYPNNQFGAKLSFGRNIGDWTFGVLTATQYYQNSPYDTTNEKNDQVLSFIQVLVQHDFEWFYFRYTPGFVKFLDNRSNDDALKKKVFPAITAEMGFPLSDNLVLSGGVQWIFAQNATGTSGPLNYSVSANAQVIGSISLLARF